VKEPTPEETISSPKFAQKECHNQTLSDLGHCVHALRIRLRGDETLQASRNRVQAGAFQLVSRRKVLIVEEFQVLDQRKYLFYRMKSIYWANCKNLLLISWIAGNIPLSVKGVALLALFQDDPPVHGSGYPKQSSFPLESLE